MKSCLMPWIFHTSQVAIQPSSLNLYTSAVVQAEWNGNMWQYFAKPYHAWTCHFLYFSCILFIHAVKQNSWHTQTWICFSFISGKILSECIVLQFYIVTTVFYTLNSSFNMVESIMQLYNLYTFNFKRQHDYPTLLHVSVYLYGFLW